MSPNVKKQHSSLSWREIAQIYKIHNAEPLENALGISRRTVQRWTARNEAPIWAKRLVLALSGEMGAVFPKWTGWTVRGNLIYDNENVECSKETIYMNQIAGSLVTREIKKTQEVKNQLSNTMACMGWIIQNQNNQREELEALALFIGKKKQVWQG